MKNFGILLFVIFIFISCSKDSNNDNGDTPKQVDKSNNLKASGDSANDILSNTHFNKLTLEMAYVKGFKPSNEGIANFVSFIKSITFKEDISIVYQELDSPNETDLTIEEVDNLEKKNRTIYNDSTNLSIYIYFADAPYYNDDESKNAMTLGVVYRNTSMVIYQSSIKKLAAKSPVITESTIETATLNHELGHLMGLVNLGSTMVHNHEEMITNDKGETVGSNHCNVENCLMNTELEFGSGMKKVLIASKNAIPSLDAECLADLKANGGR